MSHNEGHQNQGRDQRKSYRWPRSTLSMHIKICTFGNDELNILQQEVIIECRITYGDPQVCQQTSNQTRPQTSYLWWAKGGGIIINNRSTVLTLLHILALHFRSQSIVLNAALCDNHWQVLYYIHHLQYGDP